MERKTILVIDDDPDIIETVQLILSAHDYNVLSASSGAQGLEVLQASRPDLILCDMMMESIDSGMQITERISREHNNSSKIPVVLLSSIAEMTAANTQINELGFKGIIQKPINPERLVAIVHGMLN